MTESLTELAEHIAAEYRSLVRDVADEKNIDHAAAAAILGQAGRRPADLQADVARLLSRRRAAAELAEAQKLTPAVERARNAYRDAVRAEGAARTQLDRASRDARSGHSLEGRRAVNAAQAALAEATAERVGLFAEWQRLTKRRDEILVPAVAVLESTASPDGDPKQAEAFAFSP